MTMETLTIDPKTVDLEELIEIGTRLHGHLGPFLVAGIRMGLLALKLLESPGYFGIKAVSETGNKTPLSCLTDGVQIGSGCTIGKGNLEVIPAGAARGRFETEDGRAVTIALRPEIRAEFESGDLHQESERAKGMPVEELFTWKIER